MKPPTWRDLARSGLRDRPRVDAAAAVEVQLGIHTHDAVELLSGVQAGDTVILTGGYGLGDKAKIRVKGAAPAAGKKADSQETPNP